MESAAVHGGKGLKPKPSDCQLFILLHGVTSALSYFSHFTSNKSIPCFTILSHVQYFIAFFFLQSDS